MFLDPLSMSPDELAEKSGIDPDELTELLCAEIPCTVALAKKLGSALGIEHGFWLSAQEIYDTWLKREGLFEEEYAAN
jgi:plasmid maintenance system antidote protein VapI